MKYYCNVPTIDVSITNILKTNTVTNHQGVNNGEIRILPRHMNYSRKASARKHKVGSRRLWRNLASYVSFTNCRDVLAVVRLHLQPGGNLLAGSNSFIRPGNVVASRLKFNRTRAIVYARLGSTWVIQWLFFFSFFFSMFANSLDWIRIPYPSWMFHNDKTSRPKSSRSYNDSTLSIYVRTYVSRTLHVELQHRKESAKEQRRCKNG